MRNTINIVLLLFLSFACFGQVGQPLQQYISNSEYCDTLTNEQVEVKVINGIVCDCAKFINGVLTPVLNCDNVGLCKEKQVDCQKSKSLYTVIDNTGTRFSNENTIQLYFTDGTTATVVQTPQSGWTAQLQAWDDLITDVLAAKCPAYTVETRFNPSPFNNTDLSGYTPPHGLLVPPSELWGKVTDMKWRYLNINACSTCPAINRADVIAINGVETASPIPMTLQFVEGLEIRYDVCQDCSPNGVEKTLFYAGTSDLVPESPYPVCLFGCDEPLPAIPASGCNFQIRDDLCDLGVTDINGNFKPITVRYTDCGDGEVITDVFEVDPADATLVPYDVIGGIGDCINGTIVDPPNAVIVVSAIFEQPICIDGENALRVTCKSENGSTVYTYQNENGKEIKEPELYSLGYCTGEVGDDADDTNDDVFIQETIICADNDLAISITTYDEQGDLISTTYKKIGATNTFTPSNFDCKDKCVIEVEQGCLILNSATNQMCVDISNGSGKSTKISFNNNNSVFAGIPSPYDANTLADNFNTSDPNGGSWSVINGLLCVESKDNETYNTLEFVSIGESYPFLPNGTENEKVRVEAVKYISNNGIDSIKYFNPDASIEYTENTETYTFGSSCDDAVDPVCTDIAVTESVLCVEVANNDFDVNDYILVVQTFECQVFQGVKYYDATDPSIEVDTPPELIGCTDPPQIVKGQTVCDIYGNEWQVNSIIDPITLFPISSYFIDENGEVGTPNCIRGDCPPCSNPVNVDKEKSCAIINGIQYSGFEHTYYYEDSYSSFFQPYGWSNMTNEYLPFCCDDCIQISECFGGRGRRAVSATLKDGTVILVQDLVLDGIPNSVSDLAQTVINQIGGTVTTATGEEDALCGNTDFDAFIFTNTNTQIDFITLDIGDIEVQQYGDCTKKDSIQNYVTSRLETCIDGKKVIITDYYDTTIDTSFVLDCGDFCSFVETIHSDEQNDLCAPFGFTELVTSNATYTFNIVGNSVNDFIQKVETELNNLGIGIFTVQTSNFNSSGEDGGWLYQYVGDEEMVSIEMQDFCSTPPTDWFFVDTDCNNVGCPCDVGVSLSNDDVEYINIPYCLNDTTYYLPVQYINNIQQPYTLPNNAVQGFCTVEETIDYQTVSTPICVDITNLNRVDYYENGQYVASQIDLEGVFIDIALIPNYRAGYCDFEFTHELICDTITGETFMGTYRSVSTEQSILFRIRDVDGNNVTGNYINYDRFVFGSCSEQTAILSDTLYYDFEEINVCIEAKQGLMTITQTQDGIDTVFSVNGAVVENPYSWYNGSCEKCQSYFPVDACSFASPITEIITEQQGIIPVNQTPTGTIEEQLQFLESITGGEWSCGNNKIVYYGADRILEYNGTYTIGSNTFTYNFEFFEGSCNDPEEIISYYVNDYYICSDGVTYRAHEIYENYEKRTEFYGLNNVQIPFLPQNYTQGACQEINSDCGYFTGIKKCIVNNLEYSNWISCDFQTTKWIDCDGNELDTLQYQNLSTCADSTQVQFTSYTQEKEQHCWEFNDTLFQGWEYEIFENGVSVNTYAKEEGTNRIFETGYDLEVSCCDYYEQQNTLCIGCDNQSYNVVKHNTVNGVITYIPQGALRTIVGAGAGTNLSYAGNDIATAVDFIIEWGDGSTDVFPNAVPSSGAITGIQAFQHIYPIAGNYYPKAYFVSDSGLKWEANGVIRYPDFIAQGSTAVVLPSNLSDAGGCNATFDENGYTQVSTISGGVINQTDVDTDFGSITNIADGATEIIDGVGVVGVNNILSDATFTGFSDGSEHTIISLNQILLECD